MNLDELYRGKKVLVTGHNGFKGTWLTQWLIEMGADVYGVSLKNKHEYSLFEILDCKAKITQKEFDIRDYVQLLDFVKSSSPEIVFHLAAQPFVLESYNDPVYTHQVNYVGTLNVLDSIRNVSSVKTVVVVTSDKVYKPNETGQPLNESAQLGGIDPYSASKSAVELLVNSYRESYYKKLGIQVFTARAGNVIGFGDWGKNRLIPDMLRSIINKETLKIRNPNSIRPWQHVNDVIYGYILLAFKASFDTEESLQSSFNFGPSNSIVTVWEIVQQVIRYYEKLEVHYEHSGLIETNRLILDSNAAKQDLLWVPIYDTRRAIQETLNQFELLQNNRFNLGKNVKESIRKYILLKTDL